MNTTIEGVELREALALALGWVRLPRLAEWWEKPSGEKKPYLPNWDGALDEMVADAWPVLEERGWRIWTVGRDEGGEGERAYYAWVCDHDGREAGHVERYGPTYALALARTFLAALMAGDAA